jgi:hypothetical protein
MDDSIMQKYNVNPYVGVQKLSDNIWQINTPGMIPSNVYLVEGSKEALVIDTGWGIGDLKGLIEQASTIPQNVERCCGLKIIGEKFYRTMDYSTGLFIKTEGPPVTYIDENGNEVPVDEPTGGLILDDKGHAMLNPYYDERVKIISISNRDVKTNIGAQEALDVFMQTEEAKGLKCILCFGGDASVGASEKLLSMHEQGHITEDLSKLAVFGADLTETTKKKMLESLTNKSLLRGVLNQGDRWTETVSFVSSVITCLPSRNTETLSDIINISSSR